MFYLQVMAGIGVFVLCAVVLWTITASVVFERNLKVLDKVEEYKVYSVMPPIYKLADGAYDYKLANNENHSEIDLGFDRIEVSAEDEITKPYIKLPTFD